MRHTLLFTLLLLLASCVAPQRAAPPVAPVPAPASAPAPARPPAPDRYAGDWSTADLGPGEWSYQRDAGGSLALFGADRGSALAMVECRTGSIRLGRAGVIPAGTRAIMRVRTSFAERQLPLHNDSAARMLVATLDAADPLFDQIIYSRGRFVIESSYNQPLLLPVRPEIARVIEDCRG